ncbi:MAG TPA: M1 family aminopeptidase, partial [Chthonomonadaceae bacterium]|nr:M1 family aminopeptidase [Chthonomonadaceae bacterium]
MRKRYWPVLALVTISLFTVAYANGLRQNPQAAEAGVPAELNMLMTQAVAAANARDPRAFAPLTEGDAARRFAWTRSQTSHWQGGILTAPTPSASPTYLAVFHAWHTCESDGDHVHTLAQTPQGWRLGPEIPETETGGLRLRDHKAQVTLNVRQQQAAITDYVRMELTGADAPPFALLRLSPDFRVTTLNLGRPDGPAVPFRQVGGVIAYTPPAEKSFTLFMQYAGVVHHQESDYITTNEATLNSYWLPHTARLPATATITVTTPPGWDAVAPGELVREQRNADGALIVTYRNDLPISFYTLDVGRYTVTKRTFKGRTLATYFLQPDAAFARRCLDRLERAMAFYETHFGPFPYTRYSLVQTQGAFAGALESYSFATFGPRTLPDYIPHELAHTWWGGLVPCTYTRSMWNESFATYSDDLFQRLAEQPVRASVRTASASKTRRAARRLNPAHYTVPLTEAHDTSDERHITVGYGKGT